MSSPAFRKGEWLGLWSSGSHGERKPRWGLQPGAVISETLEMGRARRVHAFALTAVLSFAVYHAIYLEELTAVELTEKLAQLFSISPHQISQIYKQGPTGIHVLISDEVGFSGQSLTHPTGCQRLQCEGEGVAAWAELFPHRGLAVRF